MTWQCNVLHHHHPATQRRDRGQKRNTESGRKRYARYLRCIYMVFLTLNLQEGGFAPRVAHRSNSATAAAATQHQRNETRRRGGFPLSAVFPSTQTRRGGGNPFSVMFPSTQT